MSRFRPLPAFYAPPKKPILLRTPGRRGASKRIAQDTGSNGVNVNPRLKQLMKELGQAINESLSNSEQIAGVIEKIKADGFDVFLVLEATIGFNRRDEEGGKPQLVNARRSDPEFKVNAQDMKFLKSLRISLDDAA